MVNTEAPKMRHPLAGAVPARAFGIILRGGGIGRHTLEVWWNFHYGSPPRTPYRFRVGNGRAGRLGESVLYCRFKSCPRKFGIIRGRKCLESNIVMGAISKA